ncbi:MAG TPA: hypothetical protein VH413_11345 [Verrucomicrobiae bacterium]|jgi:hypothetical protein|nr:hypothetical protein [Verrucomicrobiae bacterium]
MQVSRILPDLQCSLLCEEVRQDSNGNPFLIGVLSYLPVQQLPVTALRLCMFNRWSSGVGQFVESVRLIAPDKTTVIRKSELKFELRDPMISASNVTAFTQVEFKVPGAYIIEVLVDDVMKLRYPVPLLLAQQPPQTPKAPAEPAA